MKRVSVCAAFLVLFVISSAMTLAQDGENTLPDLPGLIAYIGEDYNVYSLDPKNNVQYALTEDAEISENSLQVYRFPTWSTDGRLAYFGLSANTTDQTLVTDVYVSGNGSDSGTLVYSGENESFNYAYWSPQNCAEGDNCRDLAVLLGSPDANGLVIELIRDGADAVSNQTIGTGLPFYYSWSPDGTRMLWQRNNQSVDIYDITTSDVTNTLPQLPGAFASPGWSPVDDRWLFGALSEDERSTDLVIVANGEMQTLASSLEGQVAFSWSADGNKVIYTNQGGPLFVLDAVTGETIARSSVTGVLAFFWSPDSNLVAYVTLATSPGSFSADAGAAKFAAALVQGETGLAWSVLDVRDGSTRRYSTFMPTREMAYLLTYFDQFAQSHRIWSPDSRHLIYSEITQDERQVITLLDVTRADTVPLFLADGVLGVWSFE